MKHLIPTLFLLWAMNALSQEPAKVNVTKAGTLSTLLTKAQQDTCQHLVVTGKLNSADIKALRKMAGEDGHGSLHTLDLKDATIVSSDVPYLTIRNAEEKVVPELLNEYVHQTLITGGGGRVPSSEASWYLSDEYLPVEEYYGGNPNPELRHVSFFLLGDTNKKLSERAIHLNMAQWKKMKRQKTKAKGHLVEPGQDGHFTYFAFTRKKLFSKDMFYLCPNLRLIIIPAKGNLYGGVTIVDDPIRYMEQAKALRFK
ncbi:MAG: hypothetical protein J6I86_02335 [Bacteroidaceae bacterium]|nr:hypothetical protein [Bacteroidaceae bacterium]